MKKNIIACVHYNVLSDDLAKQHRFCPKGKLSWCKWQQDVASGTSTYKDIKCLPAVFFRSFKACVHGFEWEQTSKQVCTWDNTECEWVHKWCCLVSMPKAQASWCESCSVCCGQFCPTASSRSNKYTGNHGKVVHTKWEVHQAGFSAKNTKRLSQTDPSVNKKDKKEDAADVSC